MYEDIPESNLLLSFFLVILLVPLAVIIGYVTLATWNWIAYSFYHPKCGSSSCLLPSLNCSPIATYFLFFKSVYRIKMKNIPSVCLCLQFYCGLCKMFERQRIFIVWLMNRRIVLFYKPETVEVVLSSTVMTGKSFDYKFLQPWLGTGLLTSTGNKWRSRRKLLTPAFHFRILEDFLPIFDEQSRVLVSKLKNLTEQPWFDVVPIITSCTLDIICQTAMGVKLSSQVGGCSEYVNAIYNMREILLYRAVRPWLWNDAIFFCFPAGRKFKANLQLVHNFTRKIIREKKTTMLENLSSSTKVTSDIGVRLKQRQAFLELLLKHHLVDPNFTEEDIREEVDTFMFAGHDTTAMAICWTLYNLGLHPDIQDKALRELDLIFEDDSSRYVIREDLTQMKYLECIIKETLRLYPSAPMIARECKENFSVCKYTIPAGSACLIFPLMLHRNPESFPNPEKFDPERFFPENCKGRHPYAYVPFSAGPRNCIGQKYAILEVKTVVANILRNFRVESLDPRDRVNVIPDLIIRNVDPLRMRFTTRE